MAKYINKYGPTHGRDVTRFAWIGICGYWTDDWDKLKLLHSMKIPSCPLCNVPGYTTDIKTWVEQAKKFEDTGYPRYLQFLAISKESCSNYKDSGKVGPSISDYRRWMSEYYPREANNGTIAITQPNACAE